MNRYGLSRSIPEPIKRAVRQRCGFGCVICGAAIYQYEHFSPEFDDAESHEAAGITLLCGSHHDQKTRGRLSRDAVIEANENPFCLRRGFSDELFDIGTEPISVQVGTATFTNVQHLIAINWIPVLSLKPAETAGEPARLSADFTDSTGRGLLRIRDNEIQALATNWDITTVGKQITIRSAPRDIALSISLQPRRHFRVDRLDMQFLGARLRGDLSQLSFSPDGRSWAHVQAMSMSNGLYGILLENGFLPQFPSSTRLHR